MAERKPTLTDTLITKKGAAAPVSGVPSLTSGNTPIPKGTKDTIAVTVRLDHDRYDRLIAYSTKARPRMKNQEILVRALDRFLDAEE